MELQEFLRVPPGAGLGDTTRHDRAIKISTQSPAELLQKVLKKLARVFVYDANQGQLVRLPRSLTH